MLKLKFSTGDIVQRTKAPAQSLQTLKGNGYKDENKKKYMQYFKYSSYFSDVYVCNGRGERNIVKH